MPENPNAAAGGVVIASILPTLKDMPAVLDKARTRVARGSEAAGELIARCEGITTMTPELDDECQKMIVKLNTTTELMQNDRKPFTQMIDEIKKAFTETEGTFKPLVERLQQFRNQRAREVAAENKRREEEAAKQAAKGKEAADLLGAMIAGINTCLNNKLFARKQELQNLFNGLTLADIDERGEKLRNLNNGFPIGQLDKILDFRLPAYKLHNEDEVRGIRAKADHQIHWDAFYQRYMAELDDLKVQLVDRLASKKNELLEAKRLADEQERIDREKREADERRRKAEKDAAEARNQQEREAAEKRRQQAEKERQEAERQAEEARQKKAEADKIEADRIEAQRIKDEEEKRKQEEAIAKQADATRMSATATTLFDAAAAAQMKEPEPETRKKWVIDVKDPAGWGEIIQFWFINQMADLWVKDRDKVGKTDLNDMKKYAEKKAETQRIESTSLVYREELLAINRAEKKGGK